MNKQFWVIADYPFPNKQAVEFLKYLDLGLEGTYKTRAESWSITYKEGINPDIENTIKNIKKCLQELGCIDIIVYEME